MTTKELESELRRLRSEAGYGNFYFMVKKLIKERIEPTREKRVHLSPAKKQKLYDRQDGLCACGCGERLLIPARSNHADHLNVSEIDFNSIKNMCLMLPQHNLKKSDKTIQQFSTATGRTMTEVIEDAGVNNGEKTC